MTNRAQKLTGRSGSTKRAVVTYHEPRHDLARTVCGLSFDWLNRQEFTEHQTCLSADASDVTCPTCKLGVVNRAAYVRTHYSLTEVLGTWVARSLYKGKVVAEYTDTDRAALLRKVSAHWGHMNHADECQAFAEVFR